MVWNVYYWLHETRFNGPCNLSLADAQAYCDEWNADHNGYYYCLPADVGEEDEP